MSRLIEKYDLTKLTTFGVPCTADLFTSFKNENELIELIKSGLFKSNRYLILGGGSNILFTGNFNGVVAKNEIDFISETPKDDGTVVIKAGGGTEWDTLVEYCCNKGYYGLENLSLIPGTVGASPVQNIGAYGVEIKDIFLRCRGVEIETGEVKTFNLPECKFGYRTSIFKTAYKNKIVITEVEFLLCRKPEINISYKPLAEHFKNHEKEITSSEIREVVISIRKSKLPDPEITGNGGSFFKNPVVDPTEFEKLQNEYHEIPFYQSGDKYKIPAAWLIEKAGFKGIREGNTGTYPKQPLVIVNYGVKSGSEIVKFAEQIVTEIKNKFGISLETEVNII